MKGGGGREGGREEKRGGEGEHSNVCQRRTTTSHVQSETRTRRNVDDVQSRTLHIITTDLTLFPVSRPVTTPPPLLTERSKGHNQHSLLSLGWIVWKSSLNNECNCGPDLPYSRVSANKTENNRM
ncbi:unnamed protein product [Boreogadus saida]